MKDYTGPELAAAVQRYEVELFPRGKEGVISSHENTISVHDWETMTESALFKSAFVKVSS